jgi:UDP-glucuronate decarboxylase
VMKILVTGGAGFLGSHLCEILLIQKHQVVCVDNLFSSVKDNIRHLFDNKNFEFVFHDVIDPLFLEVDQIFNLACPASPIHYQHDPVKTVKTNVLGTLHVLGMAKRLDIRLLQASTSEVYGSPDIHPQPESYWGSVNPIGPRSCYDEGKRVAETLMMDYHRQHGLDIRIARIFNTYGPRMMVNDGRVVSSFIVQVLKGIPLTIFGDGSQTRSFCFVSDLIRGLTLLMGKPDQIGPVNLGNDREMSILQLAETICELSGRSKEFRFLASPVDDPVQRKPAISWAREHLDWEPEVSLEEGLKKTIDYFDDLLSNQGEPGRSIRI